MAASALAWRRVISITSTPPSSRAWAKGTAWAASCSTMTGTTREVNAGRSKQVREVSVMGSSSASDR
jgi:hypothetical protein